MAGGGNATTTTTTTTNSNTKGYWISVDGQKHYIDEKGKELTGRAAYAASLKERGKATPAAAAVEKKKRKSGGGGGGRRGGKRSRKR